MQYEKGDVDQAIKLIKQGSKVNEPDEGGSAPLIYVAFATQVDACDVLTCIGSQADTNVKAQDGYD